MFSCKSGKFQGSPAIVETARLLKGTQQTPEAKPLFWPQQRVAHPPFATLSDPLDISIAYDRFVHFLTQNYLHIYIYTYMCIPRHQEKGTEEGLQANGWCADWWGGCDFQQVFPPTIPAFHKLLSSSSRKQPASHCFFEKNMRLWWDIAWHCEDVIRLSKKSGCCSGSAFFSEAQCATALQVSLMFDSTAQALKKICLLFFFSRAAGV